jgi:hypothetical protein
MRTILVLALTLAGVSAAPMTAWAQYRPIEPPKNPYALPQPAQPMQPHTPTAPAAPSMPAAEGFKPFKPYKPVTGVDTNTAPSGLYPELHKKKKSGF